MTARPWEKPDRIAWYCRWLTHRTTPKPLPVPSTPLGLRRKS